MARTCRNSTLSGDLKLSRVTIRRERRRAHLQDVCQREVAQKTIAARLPQAVELKLPAPFPRRRAG